MALATAAGGGGVVRKLRAAATLAARRAASSLAEFTGVAEHTPSPAVLEAFTVSEERFIPEYGVLARVYTHKGTAAQVLSIRGDGHKAFAIGFRTPPGGDAGVAHIMEHSVLCGSEAFPSKEPFVDLLKSSLYTFLNAMTYPDRTVYPVSSQNTQDLQNLTDVYLDAVLRPRLSPLTLAQEGWHVDFGEGGEGAPDTPPAFKGVVYNEMKGVFSSPESRLHYLQSASLFPHGEYAENSGGDPVAIPSLTWEAFQAFHAQNYHPSNARVFFWGDDDESTRLIRLDAALAPFKAADQVSPPAAHPCLPRPALHYGVYPAEEGAPHSDDFVTLGWVLDSGERLGEGGGRALGAPLPTGATGHASMGHYDVLRMQLLSELLLGDRTALLYKDLTDSGLGTAVVGSGFDSSLAQCTFSVGMQGVSHDTLAAAGVDAQAALPGPLDRHPTTRAGITTGPSPHADAALAAVSNVVTSTLKRITKDGLEPERVLAALNTLEFRVREFASTGGGYSKGMSLFLGVFGEWNAGRDPLDALHWEEALARLKVACSDSEQQAAGFPELIVLVQQLLLDNPHHTGVHLAPSTALPAAEAAAEAAAVAEHVASMSEEQVAAARQLQADLVTRQSTPDDPAATAAIPTLSREDLDTQAARITQTSVGVEGVEGAEVLQHPQPTAGIVYADVWCDFTAAPSHLLPLVPLLASLMTSSGLGPGAAGGAATDVQLSNRIGTHTGGIAMGTDVGKTLSGGTTATLCLRGSALVDSSDALATLLGDVASHAALDAPDIITNLLQESVAEKTSSVPASGHQYAGRFLAGTRDAEGAMGEVWGGLTSLAWQRALLGALTGGAPPPASTVVTRSLPGVGEVPCIQVSPHAPAVPCPYLTAPTPAAAMDMLVHDLCTLRSTVVVAPGATGVVTGDAPALQAGTHVAQRVIAGLGQGGPAVDASAFTLASTPPQDMWGWEVPSAGSADLLTVATGVGYVAKTVDLRGVDAFHGETPYLPGWSDVVSSWLGKTYLWNRVRVQGGAYGAFLSPNPSAHTLTFASYRDPGLASTLSAYAGTAEWLADNLPDAKEVSNAVVSAVGSLDSPTTPQARGRLAARRKVRGIDADFVQARRQEVLSTQPRHFAAFAEGLAQAESTARVAAVVGPDAAGEGAADLTATGLAVTTRPAT